MSPRVKRKQPNSRMCLVCGMENQLGLKASFFELENRELVAVFTPVDIHQGYPGRLHGGMTASVLDETIGRAIMVRYDETVWGVTVDFNIRYKNPIPLHQELRVITRITDENRRLFEGTGELILANGDIGATARGKYLKLPIEKIADFDIHEQQWQVLPSQQDPQEIEI